MADKRREQAEDRDMRGRGGGEETVYETRRDEGAPEGGDRDRDEQRRPREQRRRDVQDLSAQSARLVLDGLEQWQEDMIEAARDLSRDLARGGGGSASRQMARFLAAQREALERIEDTLAHMQDLIAEAEQRLDGDGDARNEAGGDRMRRAGPPGLQMMAPFQAFDVVQQMSRHHLQLWSRMADSYRGYWLGSLQAFMPDAMPEPRRGRRQHMAERERSGEGRMRP